MYIDDAHQGKTPTTLSNHYKEHYEVRVVFSGYDEYTFPGLHVEHPDSDAVSMIII
jgi:hypothetical protein